MRRDFFWSLPWWQVVCMARAVKQPAGRKRADAAARRRRRGALLPSRKPLIAFDLLSGSETGCPAGGLLSGTSNPSRQAPCRAGSHLARPACQFPPGANSSRTGAGAVAESGGLVWRRCGRSVFQISLSACGACDVGKINREKSVRAAVAHGNTETLWTAPWIGVDMK